MKRKLSSLIMALTGIALLASCSGNNTPAKSDDELWICAYNGGYGEQWLKDVCEAFTEKTGIPVHYDVSTSLLDTLESSLKNGSDYDLFMSHDIPWQRFAANGYLANLDDLYTTAVDGFSGTFKDRLVEGAADLSKIAGEDGTEHYYKVPYTQGAGGFIYNVKMFQDNGWSVPTTYDELVTLCQTIIDAKIQVGARETVKPFAWAGKDRQYYWDYPMFEWWYQLAGKEKWETIKAYKGSDGTYAKGYEVYDPANGYKEFYQAYDMWWNLIANNSANSTTTSYSDTIASARANFILGKAAMIPYASWGKYELEQTNEGPLDFDIALMKTPKATAESEEVNFMVGFGDSMIVPSASTHQDLAKQFLNFMATAKAGEIFVKDTEGSFLAFDYSDVDLSAIENGDTYIKSIHQKLSNTNISIVSTNPITYLTTNKVMPWAGNTYYYDKAASEPASYTSAIIGETMYGEVKSGWASWLKTAGLSD